MAAQPAPPANIGVPPPKTGTGMTAHAQLPAESADLPSWCTESGSEERLASSTDSERALVEELRRPWPQVGMTPRTAGLILPCLATCIRSHGDAVEDAQYMLLLEDHFVEEGMDECGFTDLWFWGGAHTSNRVRQHIARARLN